MTAFISQIVVLGIVILIIIVALSLFGVFPLKREKKNVGQILFSENIMGESKTMETAFMIFFQMEQLNHSGNVVEKFPVYDIPESGLMIGSGDDCEIQIKNNRFVGRHHAILGKDEKGMFLVDNKSKNGIFDERKEKIKQFDVSDGVIFYLANVPFRFRVINPFSDETNKNKKFTSTKMENEEGEFKGKIHRL